VVEQHVLFSLSSIIISHSNKSQPFDCQILDRKERVSNKYRLPLHLQTSVHFLVVFASRKIVLGLDHSVSTGNILDPALVKISSTLLVP
jgi:hypothetical protein